MTVPIFSCESTFVLYSRINIFIEKGCILCTNVYYLILWPDMVPVLCFYADYKFVMASIKEIIIICLGRRNEETRNVCCNSTRGENSETVGETTSFE